MEAAVVACIFKIEYSRHSLVVGEVPAELFSCDGGAVKILHSTLCVGKAEIECHIRNIGKLGSFGNFRLVGCFTAFAVIRVHKLKSHSHNVKELAAARYACYVAVNFYFLSVIFSEYCYKLSYGIGYAADYGAAVNVYVEVIAGYFEGTCQLHKLNCNRRCGGIRINLCCGKLAEVGGRREACVVALGVYGALAKLLRIAVSCGLTLYRYNVTEGNVGCPGVAKIDEYHSAIVLKNEGLSVIAYYHARCLVESYLTCDYLSDCCLGCRRYVGCVRLVGCIGGVGSVGSVGLLTAGHVNLFYRHCEYVRIFLCVRTRQTDEISHNLYGLSVQSRESCRIIGGGVSNASLNRGAGNGEVIISA